MSSDIVVVGLGSGDISTMTNGTLKVLTEASQVYLRTERHPSVRDMERLGIRYTSFDYLYQQEQDFSHVYKEIVACLLTAAEQTPIVYAVPGHPMVAEASVQLLLREARVKGLQVQVLASMSFLDGLFSLLELDPATGFMLLDGLTLKDRSLNPEIALFITQVYNRLVASQVKLTLMEVYPDDHPIKVVRAASVVGEEQVKMIPLFELDRQDDIDHLTTVYIPPLQDRQQLVQAQPFVELLNIMSTLRSPEGCPWDREQTHSSLKKYLIEETYEVLDAIDTGDVYKIYEELGDLLLQVVFHAQIASEAGNFSFKDVALSIAEKMIRRHPHVFGDVQADTSAQVLSNWDRIKAKEKEQANIKHRYLLDDVPTSFPGLLRATKLQNKAAKVGFDWPNYLGTIEKIKEELNEVLAELQAEPVCKQSLMGELGDLIFAVVNLARFFDIDAEEAINVTNSKFVARFKYIEDQIKANNKDFSDYSLEELEIFWEKSKEVV